MSKILFISDNEVLNSLYTVNLKIYTDCEVIIAQSLDQAVEMFEQEELSFDIVFSLSMIGEEDTALLALHHLIENDRDIPLVFIGKQGEAPDGNQVISDPFDIKEVVQLAAKTLNITAEKMANLKATDYYPMAIRMFCPLKKSPCDIFFKIQDGENSAEFHLVFNGNENVWPKVKSYIDRGVSVLYVPAKQRFVFAKYVNQELLETFDKMSKTPATKTGEKLEAIEQGIETIAEQFFDGEIAKEVVELSYKCMETMEEVITAVPDLKSLLKELASIKSGFLYSHSIIAGYVSSHILDNIEWGGDSHKEKIKFVLLFHDMYLTSVYKNHPDLLYEDKLIFEPALSEEEKEIVISHAAEAAEAIKRFPKCPLGVDVIIRQHHGTSNGLGFATTYKDDISPLAKVHIIAEAYTEQMLKSMYAGKKVDTPLIIEGLCERFTMRSYIKLIKTLKNIKL